MGFQHSLSATQSTIMCSCLSPTKSPHTARFSHTVRVNTFIRQLGLRGLTGFSLSNLRRLDFCLVTFRSKSVFVLAARFLLFCLAPITSLTRTAAACAVGVRQNHQAEMKSTSPRDFAQLIFCHTKTNSQRSHPCLLSCAVDVLMALLTKP